MKVNAPADAGVAAIVECLSAVPGLETLQSCQGVPGRRRGYVHFSLGESGWEGLCRFVFETLAPAIRERMEDDATVVVEANLADRPIGTINFSTDAAGSLTTVLKEMVSNYAP